ncbi:MAG: FIST C-terminal domain-containing protein [Alphaproteobacteria bacterium]|nr:FIST C-terminal domain-containing protein [Alphaproteobacteria bacterium]
MKLFPHGHATHPQWAMAAGLVVAQLRAQMALPDYADQPSLGLVYLTDRYANHAATILVHLRAQLPQVRDWSGTIGIGVCGPGVEYFDEPALSVMLMQLPQDDYRLFSGVAPLSAALSQGFVAQTALIHADGRSPDLGELVQELAQSTASGHVFGGLACGRGALPQWACGLQQGPNEGVFQGGLSGVAFGPAVSLVSRVTQGCQPVSAVRAITAWEGHVITELDGQPALDVLLADLGVDLYDPQRAVNAVRATLVGLSRSSSAMLPRAGQFGEEVMVRHILGLDPNRRAVAIAQELEPGMQAAFCRRHTDAARADLLRIGAEIREALEPEEITADLGRTLADEATAGPHPSRGIAGAIYVSCSGRGGPHFGAPHAEMQLVRRALGDVPLVGFFAGGEIAHQNLYGYTGVLTVFTQGEA